MRSLLGRHDVRLLLAGQTLSMFGDWAMIIVLGIWAKVLTGSNAQAGLVFFVFALASLAAPFGGLLVDRVHKRPLMIATHVAHGRRRLPALLRPRREPDVAPLSRSPRCTASAATCSARRARRC